MPNKPVSTLFVIWISLFIPSASIFAQAIVRDANSNRAAPPAPQPTPTIQPSTPSPVNRERDHEELRALLRTAKEAVNAKNFEALKPLFYEKFSITTVDQK